MLSSMCWAFLSVLSRTMGIFGVTCASSAAGTTCVSGAIGATMLTIWMLVRCCSVLAIILASMLTSILTTMRIVSISSSIASTDGM